MEGIPRIGVGAKPPSYPRLASLKSPEALSGYIASLGVKLDFDEEVETGPQAPLAQRFDFKGRTIGNRFCVLPMEGWDGTKGGRPTESVFRRWRRFGASGAKLIWGGEAVAVRPDGRANPRQLVLTEQNRPSIAALRAALVERHKQCFGSAHDLFVGLQLTHSGRFSRPRREEVLEPKILYHHPLLDARLGIPPDLPCLTDSEISKLVEDFVACAKRAHEVGFDFVDIKHCHGYLGHEFLSAVTRPGRYGGSLENRTRFLREVVEGIRVAAPSLEIGVRLSAFDTLPFISGENGSGVPEPCVGEYPYAFGADPSNSLVVRLDETVAVLNLLRELGIRLVCISAGSPYYTPHIQRPALFPPCDGYLPPEDPLVGVARQIAVTAALKKACPDMVVVGSAYTYLQEWLPRVAQHNVRTGKVDFVGLGRMMLPYPGFVKDVLAGQPLQTRLLCRTFSDCTTAPRNGLVSGCYPLDPFYRNHPHAGLLSRIKAAARRK